MHADSPLSIGRSTEFVRWVCESKHPVSIVEDRGFRWLYLSGRPTAFIPSRPTLTRDIEKVWEGARKRIKDMLSVRQHKPPGREQCTNLLDSALVVWCRSR